MSVFAWVGMGVVVGLWLVVTSNRFIKPRNMVREGWSGIDVQLKRRAELIPNLVETVKGYSIHERGLLAEIVNLRTQSLQAQKVGEKGEVESALSSSIANLMAVVENYPDLKANQGFLELQKKLVEIEDQIQMARRYYNGTVRNFNISVESFPGNLVAKLFAIEQAEFFALDAASERQVPKVDVGGAA